MFETMRFSVVNNPAAIPDADAFSFILYGANIVAHPMSRRADLVSLALASTCWCFSLDLRPVSCRRSEFEESRRSRRWIEEALRPSDSKAVQDSDLPVQSSDRFRTLSDNARSLHQFCPAKPAPRPDCWDAEHNRVRGRWMSETGQSPRRVCLFGTAVPRRFSVSAIRRMVFMPRSSYFGGLARLSLPAEQLSHVVIWKGNVLGEGKGDVRVDFNRSAKMND